MTYKEHHIFVTQCLADAGEARGCSTNTFVTDSFIHSLIKCTLCKYLYSAATPLWFKMVISVIKQTILQLPKSRYWFKSYGNYAEWVGFVYWWSFSVGGSAINGLPRSCFFFLWIKWCSYFVEGILSTGPNTV